MIDSDYYLSLNIKKIWKQLRQEPAPFWFFCGYLFFEYVRPQYIYPIIDFLPWARMLVIGALVGSVSLRSSIPSHSSTTVWYWCLMVWVILSATFASFPGIAYSQLNIVLNWLVVYYLFIKIANTSFRLYFALLLILLASYKMSQHAALSWAMRGFRFSRWGVAGAPGLFENAADLGVQMLLVLPLSIAIVKVSYQYVTTIKKIFLVMFPVTVIISIIATGQRNTLLGLAAMCLVTPLTTKRKLKNLVIVAGFSIMVYQLLPSELVERFDAAGTDNTSQSRLTYWQRGVEFFKDHPVLGIGYNNWVPYYVDRYPGESYSKEKQEVAHSTPITLLAELGVVGAFLYYGVAVNTILINIRTMRALRFSHQVWRDIPYALNIGIIGFLVSSIFISVAFYPFLFIHASISAALHNIICYPKSASQHLVVETA